MKNRINILPLIALLALFAPADAALAQNYNCEFGVAPVIQQQQQFSMYTTGGSCNAYIPSVGQFCSESASSTQWANCERETIPSHCAEQNPEDAEGCTNQAIQEMSVWLNFDNCVSATGEWGYEYICNPPDGWPEGDLRIPLLKPDFENVLSLSNEMAADDFSKLMKTTI